MRGFIRHPTDIPLEVQPADTVARSEALRDVSCGGLSFRHAVPLAPGALVQVRIAIVAPAFEARSRVVWCQPDGAAWLVGIEFLEADDLFRARMVEQICHIERYRQAQRDEYGRLLSGHDAAREWIALHAADFPNPGVDAEPGSEETPQGGRHGG